MSERITLFERAVMEFSRAGAKGLSDRELRSLLGKTWRSVILKLEEAGYEFRTENSRFGDHKPWRWVLVRVPDVEDLDALDEDTADDPGIELAVHQLAFDHRQQEVRAQLAILDQLKLSEGSTATFDLDVSADALAAFAEVLAGRVCIEERLGGFHQLTFETASGVSVRVAARSVPAAVAA